MRLFYYCYETTVNRPFYDAFYDLHEGFMVESPFGLLQLFCEDEMNVWGNFDEFMNSIEKFYPKDFEIVQLK